MMEITGWKTLTPDFKVCEECDGTGALGSSELHKNFPGESSICFDCQGAGITRRGVCPNCGSESFPLGNAPGFWCHRCQTKWKISAMDDDDDFRTCSDCEGSGTERTPMTPDESAICGRCAGSGIVSMACPRCGSDQVVKRDTLTGDPRVPEGAHRECSVCAYRFDFETKTSKIAAWRDVRNKAVRMRNDGRVDITRLDDDIVTADVQGDHSVYQVELYRQYPGSWAITMAYCSCKWGDWQWRRRIKYVGRMCSHELATLYEAHSLEYTRSEVVGWKQTLNKSAHKEIDPLKECRSCRGSGEDPWKNHLFKDPAAGTTPLCTHCSGSGIVKTNEVDHAIHHLKERGIDVSNWEPNYTNARFAIEDYEGSDNHPNPQIQFMWNDGKDESFWSAGAWGDDPGEGSRPGVLEEYTDSKVSSDKTDPHALADFVEQVHKKYAPIFGGLKKTSSDHDITKVVKEERDKLLSNDFNKNTLGWETGWDVNRGGCDSLATSVEKRVPGAMMLWGNEVCGCPPEETEWGTMTPDCRHADHAFVNYQGRYYDAEAPEGVGDWKDLPLFNPKGNPRPKIAMPRDENFLRGLDFTHGSMDQENDSKSHWIAAQNGDEGIGTLFWHVTPPDVCNRCFHKDGSHDDDGCYGDDGGGCNCSDEGRWREGPACVDYVSVLDKYHRKGLATELWNRAKQITPNLEHDDPRTQTDEGAAWAEKTVTSNKSETLRLHSHKDEDFITCKACGGKGRDERDFAKDLSSICSRCDGSGLTKPDSIDHVMHHLSEKDLPVLDDSRMGYDQVVLRYPRSDKFPSPTIRFRNDGYNLNSDKDVWRVGSWKDYESMGDALEGPFNSDVPSKDFNPHDLVDLIERWHNRYEPIFGKNMKKSGSMKFHDPHDLLDEKVLRRHLLKKHCDDPTTAQMLKGSGADDLDQFHNQDHENFEDYFDIPEWDDDEFEDTTRGKGIKKPFIYTPKKAEEYVHDVEAGPKREGDDFDYDTRWFNKDTNTDVLDTVKELSDRYPVTKGWFKGVRVSDLAPSAVVVPNDRRIWLPPHSLDKPGGKQYKTTGMNSLVAHEFGHVLHASIQAHECGEDSIPDLNMDDLMHRNYTDESLKHPESPATWAIDSAKDKFPGESASGYAEHDDLERFAESMRDHWLSPNPTRQSSHIGETVDFLYHKDSPAWTGEKKKTSKFGSQSGSLKFHLMSGRDVRLRVEISDDARSIKQGLMDRASLAPDAGMVFLSPQPPSYSGFWMRSTVIPLSIAFWDQGGRIIEIKDMVPCQAGMPCPVYSCSQPYWGAVEVNQGYFGRLGITSGDRIELIR